MQSGCFFRNSSRGWKEIDTKKIEQATEYLLKSIVGDQAEALIQASDTKLARFTPDSTHQFVDATLVSAGARCIKSKKIGCASTSSLQKKSLQNAAKTATIFAHNSPPNDAFVSLPKGQKKLHYIDHTEKMPDASQISNVINAAVAEGAKSKVSINGSLSSITKCISVKNSLGIDSLNTFSETSLRIIAQHGKEYGYASVFTEDLGSVDTNALVETAVKKCLIKRSKAFKKGSYRVVLEPDAVADMVVTMAIFAFSGKNYYEKRSFVNSKLGKKIISKNISLIENLDANKGSGQKIDHEGLKKLRVDLIESGIARSLVHDSFSAGVMHTKSTGNALAAPNPFGPLPMNLTLQVAPFKKNIILQDTILVTRFHYTNIEDEKNLIYTGMTRDGTFYYDDSGKVFRLPNLRFQVSIPEVLSRVIGMQGPSVIKEGFFEMGYCTAPTLMIDGFSFSGSS